MITLARYIDHTLLKPTATHIEIEKICGQVVEYGFAAACVPPPFVSLAHRLGVRTATVIGFPFGYSAPAAKLAEVERAIADGADELDVVVNLILLKDGNWEGLAVEMSGILDRARAAGKLLKVIIETGVLTGAEIVHCCRLYGGLGVDFVKTSTGYAEKGATVEAVRLMRANLPEKVRIKASGGIRDARLARELISAGADRLGCSASVNIVREDRETREAAAGRGDEHAAGSGAGHSTGGGADFY